LIKWGWIEIEGWGSGYQHWQRVKIWNKTDTALSFKIVPGDYMVALSIFDQNMLIIDTVEVAIEAGGYVEKRVETVCTDYAKITDTTSRFSFHFYDKLDMPVKIAQSREGLLDLNNWVVTQIMAWIHYNDITDAELLAMKIYYVDPNNDITYITQSQIDTARVLYRALI
jgi:hypothetical protein